MIFQILGQKPQQNKVALATGKTAYASPKLKFYGRVSALTMAGSGIDTETGKPGNCSQNTSKKACR